MNQSNNEYQNKKNDLNKNIKILNKSNNDNSSFSNSNSNSAVKNKKRTGDHNDDTKKHNEEDKDKDIAQLKKIISVTQKENNNIFKKLNKNSKSQLLLLYDNNSNQNLKGLKANEDKNSKVKPIENRKNNFVKHSTIIVKKPKKESPIIYSTKSNNNNKLTNDINSNSLNKPKDKHKSDISLLYY